MSKLRIIFGLIIICIVTLFTIDLVFVGGSHEVRRNLMEGLATELLGIAITVVFIEWYFERRRLKEAAVRAGWHILYEIDRAIWIWQEGNPWFSLSELRDATEQISKDDPLAQETLNTLVRLGHLAESGLLEEKNIISVAPHIRSALLSLEALVKYEGQHELTEQQIEKLKTCLLAAIDELGDVVDNAGEDSSFDRKRQDRSIEAQRSRFGSQYHGVAALRI